MAPCDDYNRMLHAIHAKGDKHMAFIGTIKVSDWFGRSSFLRFELKAADIVQAFTDIQAIGTAYQALTDAQVISASLQAVHDYTDPQTLSFGSSDVSRKAALRLALTDGGVGVVNLPSPVASVFVTNSPTVNTGFGTLTTFVNTLADLVYISDGQAIDDTRPNNGLIGGVWRSISARG